jgi:hypothetical protein
MAQPQLAAPQVERRATPRFALRLPVLLKSPQGGKPVAAITRDVSARGICFCTSSELLQGSTIEFTLTLPADITLADPLDVSCVGRVVRIESPRDPESESMVAAVIDHYHFLGSA